MPDHGEALKISSACDGLVPARIQYDKKAVQAFCRRHHIRRLSLFGSVVRDDFTDKSDVDVLVEFEPGKTPGLEFFTMGDELGKILGRRVDFLTPQELSKYYRDDVLREAEPVYVAA
ncbi:MAG: nucleotidyltransferase family protein [Euryarchaeota archaeon]|nr:nucleotidyltransferase family protein [Euryarchaeota archaeon]